MTLFSKLSSVALILVLLTGCGGGDGFKSPTPSGFNPSGNQTSNQTSAGRNPGTGETINENSTTSQPNATEITIETVKDFEFEPDIGSRSDKVIGRFEFALRDVTNNRYVRALNGSNMTFKERRLGTEEPYLVEVEATQSSSIEITQIDVMYLIDNSFSVTQAGASSALIEQSNKLANQINMRNSSSGATSNTTRYRTFADNISPLQTISSSNPFEQVTFEERGGGTALYQGIQQALTDLATAAQPVLFVFTDGRENASRPGFTLDTILSAAQQYGIPIYIAGLGDVDSGILNRIATTTGGQFFQADTVDQLSEVFESILFSIPAEFSVTYRPTQRSGQVEFQFVVDYGAASDAVLGQFNIDTILGN